MVCNNILDRIKKLGRIHEVKFSDRFSPFNICVFTGNRVPSFHFARRACRDIGMLCSEIVKFPQNILMFGAFDESSGFYIKGRSVTPQVSFLYVHGNKEVDQGTDLISQVLGREGIQIEEVDYAHPLIANANRLEDENERSLWEVMFNSANRNGVDPALLLRASNYASLLNLNGHSPEDAFRQSSREYGIPYDSLVPLLGK